MLSTEREAREEFEFILNEAYEWSYIAGLEFPPSVVLRECDPIAYREAFNDWLDGCRRDGQVDEEMNPDEWTAGV